jgi:hypothetical protein
MINNIEVKSNIEEDWETDGEEDACEYFRLKVDNVKKVKFEIGKAMKYKPIKYKKIDDESYKKLHEVDEYLKTSVYPNLKMKNILYNDKEILKMIYVSGEEYSVENKVEVGSSLIFEINRNSLNLVDVQQEYFDVFKKINYHKTPAAQKYLIKKRQRRKQRAKASKVINKDLQLSLNNIKTENVQAPKKKKKRKSQHKKNSTIIEIKKIK